MLGQRVVMGTVRTRDDVVRAQRLGDADGHALLTNGRVHAARNLAAEREPVRRLLESADQEHVGEPAAQLLSAQIWNYHADRVGSGHQISFNAEAGSEPKPTRSAGAPRIRARRSSSSAACRPSQ